MSGVERNNPSPAPRVFLVGLPGAGKSTVGEAVAKRLDVPFVDLDREIERRAEKSVTALFESLGEAAFRRAEIEATRSLSNERAIVAPGGGWIMSPEIRVLVHPPWHTIYLRVGAAAAAQRLGGAALERPLLAGDPVEALERLLAQRADVYEAADATIDTERLSIDEVIDRTAELASAFLHIR